MGYGSKVLEDFSIPANYRNNFWVCLEIGVICKSQRGPWMRSTFVKYYRDSLLVLSRILYEVGGQLRKVIQLQFWGENLNLGSKEDVAKCCKKLSVKYRRAFRDIDHVFQIQSECIEIWTGCTQSVLIGG